MDRSFTSCNLHASDADLLAMKIVRSSGECISSRVLVEFGSDMTLFLRLDQLEEIHRTIGAFLQDCEITDAENGDKVRRVEVRTEIWRPEIR